jgi:hypothetical protein
MREEITIVKDGQIKVIELEDFPIFEERGWSRQEEQTSAPVANANWVHSNKLVSDAVYVKEGVVYFAYDISSLVGYPAFISYVANGLSPNKYSTNWGVSGDGENRVGPAISNTPPAGEIIEDPSLTMTGFTIGGEYASTANNSFSDFVFSGFEELKTSYPWLFDEVNGQTPGLTLLFEALALGTSVTAEQLSRAGLTTGYTQGQLDYLNATILTGGDDPLSFNLNGESVTNQKFAKLLGTKEGELVTALQDVGISPEVFKRENPELYQNLLDQTVKGKITATLLDEYVGFVLGIEGFDFGKDSDFYQIFSGPRSELNSPVFNQSNSSFANGMVAQNQAISYIGLSRWSGLSKEEQNNLVELYANDTNTFNDRLQTMFDNDPIWGEKYGGKNLKYSMVVGPYKSSWQNTFGETADELDESFLEGIGLSQIDARKNYRTKAYSQRNKFFMNSMSENITNSLGGNVIQSARIG